MIINLKIANTYDRNKRMKHVQMLHITFKLYHEGVVIILVKGINQHVIEVKNTDNIYFERAILFVRPHCADLNQQLLKVQSEKYLDELNGFSGLKKNEKNHRLRRKKRLVFGAFCTTTGLVAGVITALVLTNLAKIIR